MLVIKKAQIDSFIAEDDTQLVRVLRDIVREAFHEEVEPHSDEALDSMIKIGIERARSRNFERAEDIAAFVALMFEISPVFDENEHIDALLKDASFPPRIRMEQMLGRTTDEVWKEAEGSYDANVWFPDAATQE